MFNIKGNYGNALTERSTTSRHKHRKDRRIYVLEASAGKDVAEALKRQNATDRLVIAMDVDEPTLNLIKDGVIDATIAQKPYTMASYGLKCLDDIHHYQIDLKKDYSWGFSRPCPPLWIPACRWWTRST